MREIKFRAFENGKMYHSDRQEDCKLLGGKLGSSLIATFMNSFYAHATLGQYTGLKDNNGKEIYEGDILKIESEKLMVVGWSEKFASFILDREDWAFSHWFGESCQPENCEVVGNIHENKESING